MQTVGVVTRMDKTKSTKEIPESELWDMGKTEISRLRE
jgi:hypothetical protein